MLPDVDAGAVTRDDEPHNRGPNILFPTNVGPDPDTLSFCNFLSKATVSNVRGQIMIFLVWTCTFPMLYKIFLFFKGCKYVTFLFTAVYLIHFFDIILFLLAGDFAYANKNVINYYLK